MARGQIFSFWILILSKINIIGLALAMAFVFLKDMIKGEFVLSNEHMVEFLVLATKRPLI